jgi:hypothetical protein
VVAKRQDAAKVKAELKMNSESPRAAEAALLKAAPAEVDVAVRVRGLEAARDHLLAMLREMNPEWANMAEGTLGRHLDEIRTLHGAHAVKSPFLAVIRMGEEGGEGGPPPFAILIPSDDYKGTLKELSGGNEVELKHQEGNYNAFVGPGRPGTLFATEAPLKAPEDMPKEAAYVGGSLTPHPTDGYEFHLVVPSAVGTVVAKAMLPLFQLRDTAPVQSGLLGP